MLKRNDILKKLKLLNLPQGQYCVMTGAAMVLHGIKEQTADIDIGCTSEAFQWLLSQGYRLQQKKDFQCIVVEDCIEIFENWLPEKIAFIEGIQVADVLSIRKYKEEKRREKDLSDIALIDAFLSR